MKAWRKKHGFWSFMLGKKGNRERIWVSAKMQFRLPVKALVKLKANAKVLEEEQHA
jgi:hypothetical protein